MARHIIDGYCNPPIPAKELTKWRHYVLGDDRTIWYFDDPNNFHQVSITQLPDAPAAIWIAVEPAPQGYEMLYAAIDDGTIWFTDAAQPGVWTRLGQIPQ
jgi:hypothetical protein